MDKLFAENARVKSINLNEEDSPNNIAIHQLSDLKSLIDDMLLGIKDKKE